MLSARRASPSAACAISSSAAGSASIRSLPSPRSAVGERGPKQRLDVGNGQRAQHVDPRPREQRAHHLERRVLCGRADERQRSVLEVGQKSVLLRLVETMHLIEEEQRRLAARGARRARALHRGADVLDSRHHRGELDELRVGASRDKARQGRLAGAGRPPENQRMQLSRLDGSAQAACPGPSTCCCPTNSSRRARPHPVGERPRGIGRARIGGAHCAGVPITSAPAGGVKAELPGRYGDVDRDILENDGDDLTELVLENHALERPLGVEAEERALESRPRCCAARHSTQSRPCRIARQASSVKCSRTSTVPESSIAGVAGKRGSPPACTVTCCEIAVENQRLRPSETMS